MTSGSDRRSAVVRRAAWSLAVAVLALPVVVPATIEEQRARLPPPASCDDPVMGVWRSHRYNPRWGDWMIFTLSVRHEVGSLQTLTGTIEAQSWTGSPTDSMPGPCTPGMQHWIVDMTARGTFDAATHRIEFWGTSYRIRQTICLPWARYNLDHFSGEIDHGIQEFQSINNDGGRSINEPVVFRRVSCLEPTGPEHPVVAPPPYMPRLHRGCARE